MKLPPHGKALTERLRFNNPPLHAVVCIGLDAWKRAKRWNESPADTVAMVLPADTPPDALSWPVSGLPVVLDVAEGPSDEQLTVLALVLLRAGSGPVTQVSPSRSHPFRQYRWDSAA
jgi:hypothetical protein